MNALVCAVCAFTGDRLDAEADVMVIGGVSVCMDHADYFHDDALSRAIAAIKRERT